MTDFSNRSIPIGSPGAKLGQSLGAGLEAIANAKMQQLQQNRQAQDLASLLGLPLHEANAISRLGLDKDKLINTLARYGNGGMQGSTGDQPGSPEGYPNPNQSEFSKRFNKPNGQSIEKPLTPQQKTHNDKLNAEYSNYEGIINTAKNVLDLLNNDEVELGYLANKQADWYPTSLGIPTQAFIGDAGHIYNLRTENLKGQPSKMRLEKLERDKLSPNLSKEENIRRAKRMIQEASHGLKILKSTYPQHNFVSSITEENQIGGGKTQQNEQQMPDFEVGSEIPDIPKEGTAEFDALPEGYGFEENGIEIRKRGNRYVKTRAKA